MAWQGKSAADKRHHERVAQMPCLVCGAWPVDVHHVVGWADRMGRAPKRHDRVAPLCRNCHLNGKQAVHAIGHRGFYAAYGVDLMAEAERIAND